MIDKNNDNPYGTLNGQGIFGINRKKWFKGEPLSGLYSFAQIFTATLEEPVNENLYFYQKIYLELTPLSTPRQEFSLEIGLGGGF